MLKLNRPKSYLLLTFIYVLASVFGILIYIALPYDTWLKVLIADVSATAFVYMFSLILNNASVYDPYWSVAPAVILTALCFASALNPIKWALVASILIWSVRLTANFAYTFHSFEYIDWRYAMIKDKTGRLYPLVSFLGIHLFPTVVVYLCVLPAVFVITSDKSGSPLSLIFAICILLSVLLQGTADYQMHKYRKNKTTPFIRCGVWKYSRHPNYLAEILVWWFVAFFAASYLLSSPLVFVGAIVNTLMFLFVSIPMADTRQSRKAGFLDYKSRTRMLLPIKK